MKTLPRAPPKPRTIQSREPSRSTTARWEPKSHPFSLRAWPETKRSFALAPTTSSTTVVNSPSSSERYSSQISASAPSSRTTRTRQCIAVALADSQPREPRGELLGARRDLGVGGLRGLPLGNPHGDDVRPAVDAAHAVEHMLERELVVVLDESLEHVRNATS